MAACRAANGRFKRCGTGGRKRRATKGLGAARKGKCLKWSSAKGGRKRRCLKRAKR